MRLTILRLGGLLTGAIVLASIVALALKSISAQSAPDCQPTFHDDFNGSQIDTSRWNIAYPSGKTESQFYAPDAFELSNGVLHIKADRRPQQGYRYSSGIITTQHTFSQQYGYFEIRAKVPQGQGLWPAFWLLHTGLSPWMEIDIFEILGHNPSKVYLSNHWPDAANKLQGLTRPFTGPDFSTGFHIFAVDWRPNYLAWYVDGVKWAETDQHVPAEPMFILANLAVGGKWPGYPDPTTPFPAYFDIDYIRVYPTGCQPPISSMADGPESG